MLYYYSAKFHTRKVHTVTIDNDLERVIQPSEIAFKFQSNWLFVTLTGCSTWGNT